MAAVKKLWSNLRLGKEHQSSASESKWHSGLHRANARLGRKKDKGATLDGIVSDANEAPGAHADASAAFNIPRFSFQLPRSYSFEVGASVEDFEIELQSHTRHIRKKLRKHSVNAAPGPSTPTSKFGLKVDHVKLPLVDCKAKSTANLPLINDEEAGLRSSSPLSSRYGLPVHPSNLASDSKGTSFAELPSKLRTPFASVDPDENAFSSSCNSTPLDETGKGVIGGHDASSKAEASGSFIGLFQVGRELRQDISNYATHILAAESADKDSDASGRVLLGLGVEIDRPSANGPSCTKGKGKARHSWDEIWLHRRLHSMPGAYPVVESANLATLDRIQTKVDRMRQSTLASIYGEEWIQKESARIVKETWLDEVGVQLGGERRMEAEAELDRVSALEVEAEANRASALELEAQLKKEQEEAERLASQPKWRECVACVDSKDPLDFPVKAPTSTCIHKVGTCSECLESWMASEFDTKGCEGVKCPECPESLTYNDVHRAASKETFEKFDKLTIRNALGAFEEFSWCLDAKCGSGQLNVGNKTYMHCASCGYKQCLKHKVAWHKDETCEQYEYRSSGQKSRDEEKATEKMIDEVSKKCPGKGCGWRIQKTEGCEHMTCKKCKHQFCWQCLASHTEIKRVGNTAHATTCKFHSHNLDISYPFNAH